MHYRMPFPRVIRRMTAPVRPRAGVVFFIRKTRSKPLSAVVVPLLVPRFSCLGAQFNQMSLNPAESVDLGMPRP
jgi:hypothetical protein